MYVLIYVCLLYNAFFMSSMSMALDQPFPVANRAQPLHGGAAGAYALVFTHRDAYAFDLSLQDAPGMTHKSFVPERPDGTLADRSHYVKHHAPP
jgi:hypothetical protein